MFVLDNKMAIADIVASRPSLIRNGIIVIVVALIAYIIYYYVVSPAIFGKDTTRAHMIPLTKAVSGTDASGCATVYDKLQLSPWYTGGEYTLSTWLYIDDWNVNAGNYRHIFSLVSGNRVLMYAILNRDSPTLIIRTCDQSTDISMRPDLSLCGFNQLMTTPNQILDNQSVGPVGVAMCDVDNIDIQRWMFLTVVARGRIIDIFMDGKLVRECVLPNIPASNPDSLFLRVGASPILTTAGCVAPSAATTFPSIGGYISNLQTYSKALAPDAIVSAYEAGPQAPTGGWLSSFLRIFTVTITFSNSDGTSNYTMKL